MIKAIILVIFIALSVSCGLHNLGYIKIIGAEHFPAVQALVIGTGALSAFYMVSELQE